MEKKLFAKYFTKKTELEIYWILQFKDLTLITNRFTGEEFEVFGAIFNDC